MIEALDIHVTGIVQGVGFRPFVYKQAKKHLISGWVLNAADGVHVHAEGESQLLDDFVMALADEAPAAAQVEQLELTEVPLQDCTGFEIRFSDQTAVQETTLVSPDLATCEDCAAELFDRENRRYRYPFINCTNCGPRFTIIDALPYDRPRTSMAPFAMCQPCAHEYADPGDRRFHAQPDACFDCGPHLSWWEAPSLQEGEQPQDLPPLWAQNRIQSDAIIARAVHLLREGRIVAVKGLGGYHLVCDAANAEALAELRRRKHREGKAFAVMLPSMEAVRAFCLVGDEEEALLTGAQRPIVLLRKRADVQLAPGLADGLTELGVMLPYTPLQHLLLHDFSGMLVMTSGNMHDEPIVTDDAYAQTRFAGLADAILGNDRPILSRYDDSVVRVIEVGVDEQGAPVRAVQFVRRARGFAPQPLEMKGVTVSAGQALFATGPEQKCTFTLARGSQAFVSQHIGDMENAEAYDAWLEAKARYQKLFEINPTQVACDRHPEYLTSKWAADQALPVTEVFHHHAHIAAVLGEHGLTEAVCGIAFDGTGFGADGNIWGGEVLLANMADFERFANFAYLPMPGGAAAIKNPLRMAFGVLWGCDLLEHPAAQRALEALGNPDEPGSQANLCGRMIEQGLNTPLTSSVGRLFDAASAILGVCTQPLYEGEGAVLLEACAASASEVEMPELAQTCEMTHEDCEQGSAVFAGQTTSDETIGIVADESALSEENAADSLGSDASKAAARYRIGIEKNTATAQSTAHDTSVVLLDPAPVFEALLDDMEADVPVPVIARRFHDAFVQVIVDMAQLVDAMYGIRTVALGGGCFLNRYLTEHVCAALQSAGFTVAIGRELPPNDGSISFGQAVVAAARANVEV